MREGWISRAGIGRLLIDIRGARAGRAGAAILARKVTAIRQDGIDSMLGQRSEWTGLWRLDFVRVDIASDNRFQCSAGRLSHWVVTSELGTGCLVPENWLVNLVWEHFGAFHKLRRNCR